MVEDKQETKVVCQLCKKPITEDEMKRIPKPVDWGDGKAHTDCYCNLFL